MSLHPSKGDHGKTIFNKLINKLISILIINTFVKKPIGLMICRDNYIFILERWVAKLVARLLTIAALSDLISKGVKTHFSPPKNIQKLYFCLWKYSD